MIELTKIKFPWVFWIRFEKRQWFSKLWKSRGANFMDIQIFNIHISIGMPWKKMYMNSNMRDYRSLKHMKHTNSVNRNKGIQIGNYDKVKHLI